MQTSLDLLKVPQLLKQMAQDRKGTVQVNTGKRVGWSSHGAKENFLADSWLGQGRDHPVLRGPRGLAQGRLDANHQQLPTCSYRGAGTEAGRISLGHRSWRARVAQQVSKCKVP